jgi:hypothetical protein
MPRWLAVLVLAVAGAVVSAVLLVTLWPEIGVALLVTWALISLEESEVA